GDEPGSRPRRLLPAADRAARPASSHGAPHEADASHPSSGHGKATNFTIGAGEGQATLTVAEEIEPDLPDASAGAVPYFDPETGAVRHQPPESIQLLTVPG